MANPDLRLRLQQRLVIDESYVSIGGLSRIGGGEPKLVNKIRPALMLLANGGPFTKWFDGRSAEDGLRLENDPALTKLVARYDTAPQDLVRAICDLIGQRSTHLERVDDEYERFFARITVNVRERFGVAIPQIGDSNAIWCRHFATSVSRVYCELADSVDRFASTAVVFIMGVPTCERSVGSLHAWNWLVDFEHGRVWAFDPQNEDLGRDYANVSSLIYTLAAMKTNGYAIPGLRSLVRRHESVHGGTTLFHLARHPIDQASRHAIMDRLRSSHFERVIPTWREELEECDAVYGDCRTNVRDFVRFADE